MQSNNGGQAFPKLVSLKTNMFSGYDVEVASGMTLRDYFAAHAPECHADWPTTTETTPLGRLAQWNYAFADAMLKERAK